MADYYQLKNQNIFNPPANTSLGNSTNQFGNAFVQNDLVLGNVTVTGATINTPKVNTIGYPGDDTAADTAGGQTITLTGSGFLAGASVLINGSAVGVVSVVSSTTITFTSPANSTGSYVLYVINTDGGTAILIPGIQYSGVPTWTTAAGSLGNVYETASFNQSVTATGDAPITYSLFSGSIPPGATFNSNGTITGTSQLLSSSTTYTFTVRATDAEAQDTNRSFSLTINPDVVTWSSPANGTTYTSTANSAISNVTLVATSAVGSGITYTANALPVGLSLTGANISGTPTVEANSSSLLTATANTTSESSSITINWVIGVANDIFFEYNTLLIPGASTTFVDDASTNNFAVSIFGDTKPNNFNPYTPGYYSNYFDGTGDYLTLPNNAAFDFGTGNVTIEAWLNIPSITTVQIITAFPTGPSAGTGWSFGLTSSGYVIIDVFVGLTEQVVIANSNPLVANQWFHIAYTRSGGTNRLFVNGNLCTTSSNTLVQAINTGGNAVYIGKSNFTGFTYPLTGYISNLRVVKGTAVYTAAFTPSTTPLTAIANTSLLTCQSNRFIDDSTNNFTITVAGNTTINSFDPFVPNTGYSTYGSAYFDGTGDYLTAPNNAAFNFGTGDFTVECWVYVISFTGSTNVIISTYQDGSNGWTIGITSNVFYGAAAGDTAEVRSSVTPAVNTWTHLALTRSSTTLSLFVNGVVAATQSNSTNMSTTSAVTIGTNVGGGALNFTGYITDVRVVKGTAVYTTTFTPPSAPLTAIANTSLLTLQNNQSVNNNVFLDNSTNNFLVTRAGNTTQGTFSPYGGNWSNYLTSSSGYLSFASSATLAPNTSSFTMEFWYNNTSTGSGRPAGNGTNSAYSTDRWVFATNAVAAGKLEFAVYNYSSSAAMFVSTSSTVAYDGQWHHVAVVRSGNTWAMFIDGARQGSAVTSSVSLSGSSSTLNVGWSNYTGDVTGFSGYISNFRLVNGSAVYDPTQTTITVPTSPLTAVANTAVLTCQSNRFIDISNNAFAITVNSSPTVQRFSPFNPSSVTATSYSGYFDGTGDYLTTPNNAALAFGSGDFCLEFWIYTTSFGSTDSRPLGNNNTWAANAWSLHSDHTTANEKYTFWVNNYNSGVPMFTSTSSVVLNTWTHVAVTRSGTSWRMFINGVQEGSTVTSSSALDGGSSDDMYIGGSGAANEYVTGYMSNVRAVKGTAVYTSNFTPSTTPLTAIANTSLLTCQSPTFIDNSTNNFTITAVGNSQPTIQNPFGYTSATTNGYTVSTIGGSGYFDGSDYLSVPNNAALNLGNNSWTCELWIYPTGNYTTYNTLFAKRNSATLCAYEGYLTPTNGYLGYYNGTLYSSSTAPTTNAWNHVAYVFDGTNIKIYLNGTQVLSSATSNADQAVDLYIGIYNSAGTPFDYYFGYISDFRLVKGTTLYTSNFVPPSAPLTPIQNSSLLLNMTDAGIYDAAMMNNMETVGDAKLSTAISKFGGSSVYLDGTGDYLTMINSPQLNLGSANFTIEMWTYNTGNIGNLSLFYKAGSFELKLDSSRWVWQILPSNNIFVQNGTLTANTWVHVALVRNGVTTTLYINGTSYASGTSVNAVSNTNPLQIGFGAGGTFTGYIDDFRFTNGVARYTSNFTPATSAFPIF